MKHIYGRAFMRGAIEDDVLITILDGAIVAVEQTRDVPRDAERTSSLVVPGFVDLHIHGGDGADFMDGDERANARILAFHARNGTTALMATTLTGSVAALQSGVGAIARSSDEKGAEIIGIHLEGPYINRDRAGAQDVGSIRPADILEIESLLNRAFDRAVATLSQRRNVLDGMAEALLAQGSLDRDEFLAILGEAA